MTKIQELQVENVSLRQQIAALGARLAERISEEARSDNLSSDGNRFRALFETMAQGVVYQDSRGAITLANPAAERLLGLTQAELQGRDSVDPRWHAIHLDGSDFPGDDHPAMIALRMGSPVKDVTMGIFHPIRGEYVWLLVNAVPEFRDDEPAPYRVYTTFSDITDQKKAEALLRQSEERFHRAFDNMLEGAQILDFDWRYVYLNIAAETHNCRPNQELIGKRYTEAWSGIETTSVFSMIKRCMDERVAVRVENRFEYPDGRVAWFDLSIQPIPEGVFILSLDITERVLAEKQAEQMKRLYATLSQVNQTIVRSKDRDSLFQSVCEVAVRFGGFSLAWIGLLDEASGNIQPVVATGLEIEHWPFQVVNLHQGPFTGGLLATAIRTSTVITSENIQSDQRTSSLRSAFEKYDFHSSAAVPIQVKGKTIGVLSLVSNEIGLFKVDDEVSLLNEMGLDISFALDIMETEREKVEAEKLKQQWADAFENCAHGLAIGLPDSNQILTCNPSFARLQGRTRSEISSMPILSMYASQDHEHVQKAIAEADRVGRVRYEARMLRKDGSIYPVQMDVVSVRDARGQLLYRVATQQDITERKMAEKALQDSENRYHGMLDSMLEGCQLIDFG